MSAVGGEQSDLRPWNPSAVLDRVSGPQVQFSRGFLRCELNRLLANIGALWLPLFHSAGAEVRLRRTSQFIGELPEVEWRYSGEVEGERFVIACDQASGDQLVRTIIPGSSDRASEMLIQYLARRLISSVNLGWSRPEIGALSYLGALTDSVNPAVGKTVGGVRIELLVQGVPVVVWVGLGVDVVSQLDLLWRKQLRNGVRGEEQESAVSVVLGQLAIAPLSVVDYTKSGAVIDLEQAESKEALLWRNGRSAAKLRLLQSDGRLAVEVTDLAPQQVAIPAGTTRLRIELWSGFQSEAIWSEVAQIGSMLSIPEPISSAVRLVVNDELVGVGELFTYQGRFAVRVK